MSIDGLEYHLDNWARYNAISKEPGRARISDAFAESHNASCDNGSEIIRDRADKDAAEIMDALIDDLSLRHKFVIHNRWTFTAYIIRNEPQVYQEALSALSIPAGRRLVYVLNKQAA